MDAVPRALDQRERLVLVSHALCPYVQRAAIALMEKGIAFERVDIDLARKPAWFLALSPLGRTPLLLVPQGDALVPLFESAVICDYFDETLAPALHPQEPLQRARHRAWIEVASATLDQIWRLYTARDAAGFDAHRDALALRLQQLESALGDGPWFDSDRFSLVDAAFAPVFRYFDVFDAFWSGGLFDGVPRVRAWRRALALRPSVRDAVSSAYAEALRRYVDAQGGALGALSIASRARPGAQP